MKEKDIHHQNHLPTVPNPPVLPVEESVNGKTKEDAETVIPAGRGIQKQHARHTADLESVMMGDLVNSAILKQFAIATAEVEPALEGTDADTDTLSDPHQKDGRKIRIRFF